MVCITPPRGSADRRELDDIAALVEFHVVLFADADIGERVHAGVKVERASCLALDAILLAEIVKLVKVVRIAGALRDTLTMGLAKNFDFHVDNSFF